MTHQRETIFININYADVDTKRLEKIPQGDWIDLYADETCELLPGDFKLISLGVVIKLPRGHEGYLLPRSSTFKNHGIIQTNGMGIVDESYCGPNDVWKMPVYATRHTTINRGDKIAQFRIAKKMGEVILAEIKEVNEENRGGFGSTGKI